MKRTIARWLRQLAARLDDLADENMTAAEFDALAASGYPVAVTTPLSPAVAVFGSSGNLVRQCPRCFTYVIGSYHSCASTINRTA